MADDDVVVDASTVEGSAPDAAPDAPEGVVAEAAGEAAGEAAVEAAPEAAPDPLRSRCIAGNELLQQVALGGLTVGNELLARRKRHSR